MTKRLNAKKKITRSLRANLWGDPKAPFNTRAYAPGEHGQRRRPPSGYGLQLRAKQMLRGYYGNITEKQFRNIYKEALRRKGNTSENLIELLERRLDAVLYRLKFAPTVFAARQMINHGHVKLNGRKHNIGSALLADGDEIQLSPKMQENEQVMIALQQDREVPEYLDVDMKKLTGKFIRGPKFEDVPYPVQMEPNLVVEYYSQ